jgi:hypothetical protein
MRAQPSIAVHRGEIRQVALYHLSAEPAQGVGALVLPPDQGAHLVALGEQHCGEVAADGADGAGRSGHEDRAVVSGFHHHIAGSKLRSESFSGFRSFIGQIIGPGRSAPRQYRVSAFWRRSSLPRSPPTCGSRRSTAHAGRGRENQAMIPICPRFRRSMWTLGSSRFPAFFLRLLTCPTKADADANDRLFREQPHPYR